jgi:protein phosphatase
MIVRPGNCQHIGARGSQQDAFGFSDKDDLAFVAHGGVLAVVADGMGGMANGGEASHLAVRAFLQSYMAKPAGESVPTAMLRALDEANQAVITLSHQVGEENVGTTLVAAVIHGDTLHWVSVGDSRLYLWRNVQLTQLSEDHIYANDLDRDAASGNISREDAENHPERCSLTSYLGLTTLDLVDHNLNPYPLLPGDRLLLCSDGFYAALEEIEIVPVFEREAQQTAEDLVALVLAKDRPGQDNLTVAIFACESDSAPTTKREHEMSPPKKHLGWIVGGGMAGLAMAVAAFWYLFIAPAAVPVLPVVPSITATPIKPE